VDPSLRLVTQAPLPVVWGPDGLDRRLTERARLSAADVRDLLRESSIALVVADPGHPIRWAEGGDRFDLWKREISVRFADPSTVIHLEDFPGEYCYFAHEWAGADGRSSYSPSCIDRWVARSGVAASQAARLDTPAWRDSRDGC
jgi:hypothetical protein